ncbi:hypothetical protein CTI12_AA504660 [Artemisia annua]|uniref:Uncharacterized protein n=1 Tax=Artemisia annua TaxID=35608 RepID=A0A2U1LD80_ARTAN|nr:hypothetical protein CTI12_AA504660 [Artemisia annua]
MRFLLKLAAHDEITTKENVVKQQAKVADNAVSEVEAATLKNHLESVTLLKLTAEDKVSHLHGALKECMRQIRNIKEEHTQNIYEHSSLDAYRRPLTEKLSSF